MKWLTLSILGFVLLLVASFRRRGADKLPAISSEEFVARFGQFFSASAEQVIEGRKRVARVLGVQAERLAPEHTYKELARWFDTLGNFSVAWSDLEYEVQEIAREQDPLLKTHPATVGDLVAGLIQARRI